MLELATAVMAPTPVGATTPSARLGFPSLATTDAMNPKLEPSLNE